MLIRASNQDGVGVLGRVGLTKRPALLYLGEYPYNLYRRIGTLSQDNGRIDLNRLLPVDEEAEVRLFDELLKLPKDNRARLIEAIRVYELLEETTDSAPTKTEGS
jgi:hypothetical protein